MIQRQSKFKKLVPAVIIIVVVILAAIRVIPKMESAAPLITSDLDRANIGRSHEIEFTFSEQGQGLKNARVVFEQNGQQAVLFLQEYPKGSRVMQEVVKARLDDVPFKIEEGPASFRALAWDYSWRAFGKGSRTELVQDVIIDVRPPVISPVSAQHNIRQGGAGLVVYGLSKPVAKTGVWVGESFYPGQGGYLRDDPNLYLAFIALGNEDAKETKIKIEAVDLAGNRAKTEVYSHIRTHKFPYDKINISDSFLRAVVPPFYPEVNADTPIEEVLEKYIYINSAMRVENDAKLLEITAKSEPLMYWEGTFLRLPNAAPRAGFGDKRDYVYKGAVVDQQTHLGVDLASLARAEIPAANRGKVVFTGFLGIYGEAVVLDHGFNLFSLYAHMSSIGVNVGDIVERGDILGRTGTTGLAVGDHLHFSMLVSGRFVDPIEWWDGSWIKNNITDKLPAP